MELLFDLLLSAFFTLLFAFCLSKLLSPSTSSTSTSTSSSASHDAAEVISGGAQKTEQEEEEDHAQEIITKAPRLREGQVLLQNEKIIEVDKVVAKEEAERGFLGQEARSQLREEIDDGKVGVCEGTELRSDCFGTDDAEFDKEKLDCGLVQTIEHFVLETSMISSDRGKKSCASEIGDEQVSQSFNLTTQQDQSLIFQGKESLEEGKLCELEVRKDYMDNLCQVEGSIDKMSKDVEVLPTEVTNCLNEELQFNKDGESSGIVQDEVSKEVEVLVEVQKAKDQEHNLPDVEGPIGIIVTEGGPHLEELTVPEEISIERIESSEQKMGEEQEEKDNLSKSEGPTSKMTQLADIEEKEQGMAFIEEEGWEGIERTDTEKQFAVAAGYATSACGTDALAKLSNEVQLQLYGLHKVATEGPCYESAPGKMKGGKEMEGKEEGGRKDLHSNLEGNKSNILELEHGLRSTARAKWHAWKKLGNMNPEAAMEEYMTLLSENVPNWSEQSVVDIEHKESDKLTIGSDSCIEGPAASDSVSSEKGTESHASIQ